MKNASKVRTLAVLIIALALPSFLSLLWHRLSGDPMMRPLGITQEALVESGDYDGLVIYADLAWDPKDRTVPDQESFARALKDGFWAKGMKVAIRPKPATGGSRVTYRIGPSTIGPMPAYDAVKGINAAVAAYRMNVPFKN